MPTVYQFDYKGHPVRAIEKDGKGYIFAHDIMPLLGYDHPFDSLKPFAERKDKIYTFYRIPVISSSIFNVISYPQKNKKKTQKLKEWVDSVVFPAIQGQIVMPDEVIWDWWEEEDCKKYFEEAKEAEANGAYAVDSMKTVFRCKFDGELVAKVKMNTNKISFNKMAEEILTLAILTEFDDKPDCVDAMELIGKISRNVIANIQEDFVNRVENGDY